MKHEKDFLEKKSLRPEFSVLLAEKINKKFKKSLKIPAEVKSDGIMLALNDGSSIELRYPNKKEYSIILEKNGRTFSVDTAPVHKGLETFPNHIHDFDGEIKKDGITSFGADPADNLGAFLNFFGYA